MGGSTIAKAVAKKKKIEDFRSSPVCFTVSVWYGIVLYSAMGRFVIENKSIGRAIGTCGNEMYSIARSTYSFGHCRGAHETLSEAHKTCKTNCRRQTGSTNKIHPNKRT
eukprot:scaffold1640_cov161-Amphora_coffeaeformis.AAC.49